MHSVVDGRERGPAREGERSSYLYSDNLPVITYIHIVMLESWLDVCVQ